MSTAALDLSRSFSWDGQAPDDAAPAPGIGLHLGLSMADYLAYPAVSASSLEDLAESPRRYRYALEHPTESTDDMRVGEALHMAVLEPERFVGHYHVAGPCEQTLASGARKGEPCGNGGKFLHRDLGWLCGQHVARFTDGIVQVETLSAQQYADVVGMRDAIRAHARARTLFEGKGGFEVTGIFRDPETGILCKFRPDRLVERAHMLVDLKKARCASPAAFPRDAESRGYWRKMAFYGRGLRVLGWERTDTSIVAADGPPYDCTPFLLDEKGLESAEAEVVKLLRQLRTCMDTDTWPGYVTDFAHLARPAWATRDNENEG